MGMCVYVFFCFGGGGGGGRVKQGELSSVDDGRKNTAGRGQKDSCSVMCVVRVMSARVC